jgi:hypothetical protein
MTLSLLLTETSWPYSLVIIFFKLKEKNVDFFRQELDFASSSLSIKPKLNMFSVLLIPI